MVLECSPGRIPNVLRIVFRGGDAFEEVRWNDGAGARHDGNLAGRSELMTVDVW